MKIAVVTGASSGMGKQFALQLSAYELSSNANYTISLGIATLQAESSIDMGLLMAGAALAAAPIIAVFLVFQKYFTKGITMGAVKG